MDRLKIYGISLPNGNVLKTINQEVKIYIKNDNIISKKKNIKENKFKNIPIIRGILSFFDIIYLTNKHIVKDLISFKLNNIVIFSLNIVAFIFFIFTYITIPSLIVNYIKDPILQIIIQIILQTVIFIIYTISLINNSKLKKLFENHNAKHIVLNYYNLKYNKIHNYNSILDINIKEIKKVSRYSKICILNHIVLLFLSSLIFTVIIPSNPLVKSTTSIIVIPFVIGIIYELILLSTKTSYLVYSVIRRIFILQDITTNTVNDKDIYLHFISLLKLLGKDKMKLNKYIKEYLIKNDIKDYYVNDIYDLSEFILKEEKKNILANNMDISLENQYELEKVLDKYYIDKVPLAYITNFKYFFNEKYYINENVLIPRSDTEILVQEAIDIIKEKNFKNVLDLCTGSGCIGISIAKNTNIDNIDLVDILDKALEVTKKNVKINKVKNYNIIKSNLFKNIKKEYDMIVSNPPYIETEVIKNLDEYVKKEPKIALDGGKNGLDIYVDILNNAKVYLKHNGYILFEIGYNQKKDLMRLINLYPYYEYVETIKDYGNNDRVVICRMKAINKDI